MKLTLIAAAIAAFGAASAGAAELPQRSAKPAAQPAAKCTINGAPGYLLPGSDVCVKMSGYVSVQTTVGTRAKRASDAAD